MPRWAYWISSALWLHSNWVLSRNDCCHCVSIRPIASLYLHFLGASSSVQPTDVRPVHDLCKRQIQSRQVLTCARMHAQVYWWNEKYRPRKPKYFNRVHTGYEWNKYNQTHYDHDNPPPKVVQGYKFNIFYPDLINKDEAPTYSLEKVRWTSSRLSTLCSRFSLGFQRSWTSRSCSGQTGVPQSCWWGLLSRSSIWGVALLSVSAGVVYPTQFSTMISDPNSCQACFKGTLLHTQVQRFIMLQPHRTLQLLPAVSSHSVNHCFWVVISHLHVEWHVCMHWQDPGADEHGSTCLLIFHAGPPYEDTAFKILNKEWEYSHKKGFKSTFERGILHLYFNFKRNRYRR